MDLFLPTSITHDMLVSSNVEGSSVPEWTVGGTFTVGQTVKVSFESDGTTPVAPVREFTCYTGHDDGRYPPDDDGTYWLDTGAINRWRWGDDVINTQTLTNGTELTDPGKLVMELRADRCNALGLFGTVGTNILFEQFDSDGSLVNSQEIELQNAAIYGDAWSYCFEDFVYIHDIIINFWIGHVQTIRVTIEHNPLAGLYPGVGYIVLGRSVYIGQTKYDYDTGINDYSIKNVDEQFGYVTLKPGNYSKWMNIDVRVDENDVDRVQQVLTAIRGKTTFFTGNNAGTSSQVLNMLGFCHDFTHTGKNKRDHKYKIEIKGMT